MNGVEDLKPQRLIFFLGVLAAPPATAAPAVFETESPSPARNMSERPVQLAQAYDFDVYIDQYGREVVVNPRTGAVVEIRSPLVQNAPVPPPARESGRGYYDLTDPRDVERFHRDREAAIGRGWSEDEARSYPEYEREDPRYGRDSYDDRYQGGYEEMRPSEPRYEAYPPSFPENRSVRRAPLESPGSRSEELAAAPPDGEELGVPDSGEQLRQMLPQDPGITVPGGRHSSDDVAAFQVLLDRAGASPGVIDGRIGDNVNKAIDAYQRITGQRLKTYDKEWIKAELEKTGGSAFIEYTITSEDAAGSYVASIPEDYGEKARLERLGYTRVSEMLAERFHMDEKYLIALNPRANFNRPGTILKVTNLGKPAESEVARIVADKGLKQVRAYDAIGRLVATYPATIGSADTPSPSGTHTVERVAFNPEYTYNPKKNFQQGSNDKVLTIPPGPNGPVGSIWIALSKPTYGVHGTPEPEKIGKTSSHGCVRLTNWDAEELAKRVKPGVAVEFAE